MIKRAAASTLKELARSFPIVAVTGPRQSGKTTLVQSLFAKKPYVSLEELDQRDYATNDPRRFLAQFPDGAVLDEVQRCPGLFSYLQTQVDNDGRSGLFILTGSQQFDLLSNITQSLAGRVALLPLLPFDLAELQAVKKAPATVEKLLFTGLYPPIYDRNLSPPVWYDNYIRSYIERDVRQLVNIRDLSTFQRFIRMCAAYTGQLVNLSSMANDCGITHNTAKAWISVLEASYIVYLLQPHHQNFKKRLVKSPKLYFYDTGIASHLLGIQTPQQLAVHPQRGALFESWVVAELLKQRFNHGLSANLFFWRDQSGNEVDLLVEHANKIDAIEIKSGQTIASDFFRGLNYWSNLVKTKAGKAWLIYGGQEVQNRQGTHVLSWKDIHRINA